MSSMHEFTFTSESVTEGHPDKVCDFIADSVLDACFTTDPRSRVACEVLCKDGLVVLGGEITTKADFNYDTIVRNAVREIGYVNADESFNADGLKVLNFLGRQSPDIDLGVTAATAQGGEQGAGDQGIMFGYATNETPEMMPLPILLAHRLTKGIAADRKSGAAKYAFLRPDAKSQVSVDYDGGKPVRVTTVLVSTQHVPGADQKAIADYVAHDLAPRALGDWYRKDGIRFLVNPTGAFALGGPAADAGVTGRKIIVDTYGGFARHGGGAFSGKDPSKVDRSGAYFCRFAARQLVQRGIAARAEIQVGYAIGVAQPVSVFVDTFGTGDPQAAAAAVREFDFRPAAIIERLNLLRPIYRASTNYGHFGRPGLPWED